MKSLREYISDAQAQHVAIGHFNISNIEGLWAIFRAAKSLELPVIIGTSEGERDFIGARQTVALVQSIREEYDYPIFLNADHTYSFERVQEAIDLGYDAVIFDGAKLSREENIAVTKKCVDYAKSLKREVLIEGELGYIGESSKILEEIPKGAGATEEFLTTVEDVRRFVRETGVDLVAPAVGNIHGMLSSGRNPRLSIERVASLKEAAGIPLVLHGGSGIANDDFTAAVKAGISMVHINTELRLAYRKALARSLQENPDEIAPYKLLKGPLQAMQKVVEERLKLFNQG